MRRLRARARGPAAPAALTLMLTLMITGGVAGNAGGTTPQDSAAAADTWAWPLSSVRLERPFVAPAHPYGPGHRGIDLASATGAVVLAPSDGTVAFVGMVAGRGILTIDHGDGLVTTLEPVEGAVLAGSFVTRGQEVATLWVGGHAEPGSLHFGVRRDGDYINPMVLLGGVPRAVLLPCC